MKTYHFVALLACLFWLATPSLAQQKDGGLSPETLSQIEALSGKTGSDKALQNAIANNSLDALAKTPARCSIKDTYFSVETKQQAITDQKSSGRCWLFSGLNALRGSFQQLRDSLQVDLSEGYLFFFDQLEKSNLFLEAVYETASKPMSDREVSFLFRSPIGDGGTFCGVADLTEKYGVVPQEAMAETFSAENTSRMSQLMKSKLREAGLKIREMVAKKKSRHDIVEYKKQVLATVYRMLSLTLGTPPKEFAYTLRNSKGKAVEAEKKYTPKEFFRLVSGGRETLNGTFIMVMNDPRNEYYKTYEVEYDRHTYDGHNWRYLNLPMADIEALAIASLKGGGKMYSSYDVGKFLDRKRGYADLNNFDFESLFATGFPMTKAQRIETFDSGSTHAMTLTAVDLDKDNKPLKWKVENSWGAAWGEKGCLLMSNEWFEAYMFRLVVDKKYVSDKFLKLYEQKPVRLSWEDPLFSTDD